MSAMMNLCEKRYAPRPPECTIEYSSKELAHNNLGRCVHSLLDGIQRSHMALDDKEVSSCLRMEVAILTASLYRNGRHRTEKFYRVLKKVEKSCVRWQELGLLEELDRLCHLMPRGAPASRNVRLPSKQMFEYLLARLLGTYHLMLHLDGICREAATLLLAKISIGHFFSTAVAFLSNVARIRVLAMDYAGQVAKIYDDLLPHVHHLIGSKAPPLLDSASLPSPLSGLLQQYCSSLHANTDPLFVNKLSAKISFLDALNISKEGNSMSTSKVDQFIKSPAGKKLVNKKSVNSKAKESSAGVDISGSGSFLEEDIGECVPMTKSLKKTKAAKKRKVPPENNKDSDGSASNGVMKTKSVSVNSKNKKVKKNLGKNKQSKISKLYEQECTPAFIRHFMTVKKQVKRIKSIDNLEKFLEREKKNRLEKVNGRVSVQLKKEDWKEFTKYVNSRLRNIKGLSKMDSSDSESWQQVLGKTRITVKFWLLFPHLKGKKPANWKDLLDEISSL